MKTIAKRLATALCFIICAVLLISVPLSGCTNTGKDAFHNVHFEIGDLSELTDDAKDIVRNMPATQEVADGECAVEPASPSAEGYTFRYWYLQDDGSEDWTMTPYDFSTPVESRLYLEGHWEAAPVNSYTVTFNLGSVGAGTIDSQTVTSGGTAAKPEDPVADGYTFEGWYTDSSYATEFDFSTPITSDTTIYAKWSSSGEGPAPETTISVKYSTGVLNYGMASNMPEDTEITSGSTVSEPATDPSMSKYTFDGWYTKAEGGREFDFTQALTEDTTIYAHWLSTQDSISVGAVGDSLTAPQSWSGYSPYATYLQTDLDAAASGTYTVSNYGVSGAAVTTLLDNTTTLSRQYIQSQNFYSVSSPYWTGGYNQSISDKPDIVIIMLGTNDAQYKSADQCWDSTSSLTYKTDLETLITNYQENDSQVILVTSPHVFSGDTYYTFDVLEEDVLKVNEVQREVADEMGLYLVDFHTYMESQDDSGLSWTRYNSKESYTESDHPGYSGDGLHFCNAGTEALADYLTSAVEAVACQTETGLTGNEVDVVLFAGQSNMAGRGDYTSYSGVTTSVAEGHGYAYDMNTKSLGQITEPFGADQNGTGTGYMTENSKTGSMVSAFVESYYKETEVPIVAVSASRGGSPIAAWTKGGATCIVSNSSMDCNFYDDTMERLEGAIQCVESTDNMEIRNVFVVWLQGETDGDNGTTAESYKTQLNTLYNNISGDLKEATSYSLDHLYVIPIGTYEGNNDTLKEAYNAIRQAQIEFCAAYDYADVLTLGMQDLTASGTSGYLKGDGYYVHLIQPGYEILGTNAGMNMGKYVNGETVTPQRYDTDAGEWYTPTTTTITINTLDGIISYEAADFEAEQTIGNTLVTPSEVEVNENFGRDFQGWYYTTDGGSTYTKVTSSTTVKANMTLVPYFSSDLYNLDVNNASDSTGTAAGYVHDAGSVFGTVDANIKPYFTLSTGLNTTDYTENLIVSWTGSGSITDGYWFRLLTYYTDSSTTITLGYYNMYYELTNYGSEDITITLYFTGTERPGSTNGNTYMGGYTTVTIPAGEALAVRLPYTQYKGTSSGAAANFVTAIVIGEYNTSGNLSSTTHTYSDFSLGVEIGMYAANKVTFNLADGASLAEEYLAVSGGAGIDTTSNLLYVDNGATITLPTEDDMVISTGYIFDGWYTDEDCEIAASDTITVTADTTLYAKWITKATITLDLEGVDHISLASESEGANTLEADIDSNLNELLFSEEFTALYTISDSGYVITGWYIKDGETSTLVTSDMTLRGGITVYPVLQSATGTMYVVGIDGVTISAPESGTGLAVVPDANLMNAITSALESKALVYEITASNGELTGWEYSTDEQTTWYTVTDETTIVDGMYIRPVVEYTCTITITFDTNKVTQVEYNGDSDDTNGSLTIEVTVGTSYSTVLEALTVTLEEHYASYTVYTGDASEHTAIEEDAVVSGSTAYLYIEATPKTYTLTYASTEGYMSTTNGPEDITYGEAASISFATVATAYKNESGYDLIGFYLDVDGTLNTSKLYATSDSYTETIVGNITVYPVLTNPRSEGGYDDQGHSGMSTSFQDGRTSSSSISSATVETGVFNTTLFRLETTVETTINNSTTFTDSSLGGATLVSTVRVKITASGTTTGAFPSGTRYNEQWTITNYNSDSITIILYMLDHGYAIGSYEPLAQSATITLGVGESYVFTASGLKDVADTNLFLLIGVVSAPSTDFKVGVMCDYSIGTSLNLSTGEGVAISDSWLSGYLFDYDEETYTYTIYRDTTSEYSSNVLGSGDITLPSITDLEGDNVTSSKTVVWTSDGEAVTTLGSGKSATLTLEEKYTLSIDLTEVAEEANTQISGDKEISLDAGTSLLDYLDKNITITHADGYALNGWYYYVGDTKTDIKEGDTLTADTTVYPNIEKAESVMYVISNGDVTITAPAGGSVAVTEGANLENVIESYLGDNTISYSLERTTGYTITWQYSTDYTVDNADNADWKDVTSSVTISNGMYIRPVAAYTTSVTFTFDSQIVTSIEYNDVSYSSGELTITVDEDTPYKDFLTDVEVTINSYFEGYAFYLGTSESGELIDLTSDSQKASGETVNVYVTTTTPLNKTVTIAESVSDSITLTSDITFNVLTATSITLPTADGVTDSTGKTLSGWYVEDEDENVYGTADYGVYNLGATVSVDISTGNLIIWPVYTDTTTYNLDTNGNHSTSYTVSDYAGTELGVYDTVTGTGSLTSRLSSTTTYNKNDNVTEYTVISSVALEEGYWFRLNTIATPAGISLTSGAFNFYYALTNHGTDTITVGLYHCTNGYLDSYPSVTDTSSWEERFVTLKPGQTVHISIIDFQQNKDTYSNNGANNFITVIQIESGTTDILALGIRVGAESFTSGTTGTLYIQDVTGISIDEGWLEKSVEEGTEVTLPTTEADGGLTLDSGYVFLGWYEVDENGNEYYLGMTYTFTFTYESITFKPYVLSTEDATKTVTIDKSVEGVSITSLTFVLGSDSTVTLPESATMDDSSRTLSGWYVEDEDGNIYGSAANGIYNTGDTLDVDVTTGNLIIWPVLSDSFYQLTVNSERDKETEHELVTDTSGESIGSQTNSTTLNNGLTHTTTYNKTDNVSEYTVINKNTSGTTVSIPSGYWFRFNTDATTVSGSTLTAGNYYNFYYALTNYSDENLCITLYHCTNGYMASSGTYASNNYKGRTVTIAPDETIYISICDFQQITTTAANFITIIEFNQDVSTLKLGIRIQAEDYVANTVEVSVSVDTSGIEGFTVENTWTSTGYYAGSTCSVPTSSEYTDTEGRTVAGWYYYDNNGSLVETVSAEGSFTIQSTTVVLVPYFESDTD